MFQTREEDTPAYLNFINLCGFFETVGLLCKRGHVDLDEILDLYANAIVTTADATHAHIALRRERNRHSIQFGWRTLPFWLVRRGNT